MKRLFAILAAGALLLVVPGGAVAADEAFSGMLRGASEVPPVTTNAAGTAYVFINDAQTEVKYAVSYTGLSGPLVAAHIHVGASGTNGPIALPLGVGPSTMFGTLTQADFVSTSAAPTWAAALAAIRAGRAYVNLHTAANPAGEIRAQLAPAAAGPSPTATPRPTARPTVRPTTRPSATPRPTAAGTAAPATASASHNTPPPTSTLPEADRGRSSDLAPVLLVLLVSILSGGVAVWKLQPARRPRDDWD